jgi:tRNA A37 threonylcarbamoyladenosine dehydratase
MATTKTVGQVKVEALKERLLDINPRAEIRALQQIYSEETADSFELDTYDYIVDALTVWKTRFISFVRRLVHRRGLSLRWGLH